MAARTLLVTFWAGFVFFTNAICDASEKWSARERAQIDSLSIDKLGAPPLDPSNRFADDPNAAALGEKIFNDPRFSANGKVSCASCHRADYGFTDDLPRAVGIAESGRRTMPAVGMAWQRWFFWDGRADSLWSQALEPLVNPVEHGISRNRCAQLIQEHYLEDFQNVFGNAPEFDASEISDKIPEAERDQITEIYVNTGKAIAAFVRTIRPDLTSFDVYARALSEGDEEGLNSLTKLQKEGLRLFIGKAQCINCHNGPLFSNGEFHHVGIPDSGEPDLGRGAVVGTLREAEFSYFSRWSDADAEKHGDHVRFLNADAARYRQAFKTPSLRGVADRPPYMHAGQFATLGAVLEHYREVSGKGVVDEIFHSELSDDDLVKLEAFLKSLSLKAEAL